MDRASQANGVNATLLASLACSAPTVLGVCSCLVAAVFRPGNAMPLETSADRFFVGLFTTGSAIALFATPLAVVGVALAAMSAWKARATSLHRRLAIANIVVTLAAVAWLVSVAYHAYSRTRSVIHS